MEEATTAQKSTPAPASSSPLDPAAATNDSVATRRSHSLRKLHISPGLRQRLQVLDIHKKGRVVTEGRETREVGKIPEDHLKSIEERERRHRQDESPHLRVERRGRAVSGPTPHLTLSSTGESFSDSLSLGDMDAYSDQSSIISTSERMLTSEDEDVDVLETDTSKYRLPDIGKTRDSTHAGAEVGDENQLRLFSMDRPPTPPPKDSPRQQPPPPFESEGSGSDDGEQSTNGSEPYFNPYGMSRAGSIWTLSRVSFTNQLSQLTSIRLPDASSLHTSVSSIPTSKAASRVLRDGADQIGLWIKKASEVLNGLDAEDDVEWAAAGGREGLAEVDAAIKRFESLIDVFVGAIEELQEREDIAELPQKDLQGLVTRMESILGEWKGIKNTLQNVKEQVEMAMEWEELWNVVLGEIGLEIDSLNRLIFEMEERRHRTIMFGEMGDGNSLDIGALETIVEEAPVRNARVNNHRLSLAITYTTESSPLHSPIKEVANPNDDSKLMALFARMQPLKASLDFLPMRLSLFQSRGTQIFPTACQELDNRKVSLEAQWKKLEADAESLRRELGEDQWILVFRRAGAQAGKMIESIFRSLSKLRNSLDDSTQTTNISAVQKLIDNFEAKKLHYGQAIGRVLNIIDRGVKDRLTVNGEILRLQSEMKKKWDDLQEDIRAMDYVLDELKLNQSEQLQLRDSISTILSIDRSVASSALDTPGSSPASSVIYMSRQGSDNGVYTPQSNGKGRKSSFGGSGKTSNFAKRLSSLPQAIRKTPISRSSAAEVNNSPSPNSRYASPTPTPARANQTPPSNQSNKPRWNGSTNLSGTVIGHYHNPSSPYDSKNSTPHPGYSRSVSQSSPLSRAAAQAAVAGASRSGSAMSNSLATPPATHRSTSAMAHSLATPQSRVRTSSAMGTAMGTPSPVGSPSLSTSKIRPPSTLPTPKSSARPTGQNFRRTSSFLRGLPALPPADAEPPSSPLAQEVAPSPPPKSTRPPSTTANRRVSMLPQPKSTASRTSSGTVTGGGGRGGRESRAGGRESRNGRMSVGADTKLSRWR